MMASGLPDEDKPRKCFNAANHVQLKWFSQGTRTWTASEGGRLIQLSAFVDYDPHNVLTPVILQSGAFSAQYNLAAKHNIGTEEYKNELVIVEQMPGSTELRAHLKVGESAVMGGNTIVVMCNDLQIGGQKSVLVGIGPSATSSAAALCALSPETSAGPPPTKPPTKAPSQSPTKSPTASPTAKPTPSPVRLSFF